MKSHEFYQGFINIAFDKPNKRQKPSVLMIYSNFLKVPPVHWIHDLIKYCDPDWLIQIKRTNFLWTISGWPIRCCSPCSSRTRRVHFVKSQACWSPRLSEQSCDRCFRYSFANSCRWTASSRNTRKSRSRGHPSIDSKSPCRQTIKTTGWQLARPHLPLPGTLWGLLKS